MTDEIAYEMPRPHPALERLEFLVGTWVLKGSTVAGPLGPATEVLGAETFEWLEGGFFLIHTWNTTFEVAGSQVVDCGYEFFDYDVVDSTYRTHFFNSLGPYDEEGSRYLGDFEDGALVVSGPARISRRGNADGTITVDSDVPIGEGQWVRMMTYTLTRS